MDESNIAGAPQAHGIDPSPRLIFCINSGRSGSEYLMRVLATARNVSAFHEPQPKMCGEYLKAAMEQSLPATTAQRMVKVDGLRKILGTLPSGHIYAETNHMFIKTFHDVVMGAFSTESIDVIILRRDLVKVLKSFINLGYYSDRNEAWPDWMHRVPSGVSLIRPPDSFEEMDMYDRSISYLIDIEAQAQSFPQKYPDCRVHEVFLDELQDIETVHCLFQRLNLSPTARTQEIVGVRVNERQQRKEEIQIATTEAICEERIELYLKRCREKGIAMPVLKQFRESNAVAMPAILPSGFLRENSAPDSEMVVITRPSEKMPRRGFFSLITQAISNLYDLSPVYSKFYFDFSSNVLFRDGREQNFFNNYFEQDKALLNAPAKKYVDWTIEWFLRRDAWHNIEGAYRANVSRVLHQHLKIKSGILEKVEAIWGEKFQGRRILGLHKRGTDHGMHGQLLDMDFYFSAVDQEIDRYDCLYLATDEEETLAAFRKRYKNVICLEDAYRSTDGKCVHQNHFENNYKKGEDVLIEALLLARLNFLLRTQSNVTLFSILYNKDVPYKRIDTHVRYH
jgi:hypothetical protein